MLLDRKQQHNGRVYSVIINTEKLVKRPEIELYCIPSRKYKTVNTATTL